jgi:peroxisome-assembly ATPase
MEILHQGRKIVIPQGTTSGIAKFDFVDLCDKPMGAGDYLQICKRFHTVFLKNIPKMSLSQKTQAKRFIVFIDAMYENKVKMICTADASPEMLFSHNPHDVQDSSANEMLDALKKDYKSEVTMFSGQEEIFQFSRCVSRLNEMQTEQYLQVNRRHEVH